MNDKPVTVQTIMEMKGKGEKIAVLTAYDVLMAGILNDAGIDMIIVGDSASMVVTGHETTLPITMDEMIYHTRAVVRGCRRPLIVADLPFMSYQASVEDAVRNGVITNRTIFPYHFATGSADLNELGRRDLSILADHYRQYPGLLSVRRQDASEEVYQARTAAVTAFLGCKGVDMTRMQIEDAAPGGPGRSSEEVRALLACDEEGSPDEGSEPEAKQDRSE